MPKIITGVNDLATKSPDALEFIKYPDKVLFIGIKNNKHIECQCPKCGFEFSKRVRTLCLYPFCPSCLYDSKLGRVKRNHWDSGKNIYIN